MNKKSSYNKYITLILFFIIICMTSCTALIDIKTDDAEARLCIYGMITTNNEYQKITLSSSAPCFDNQPNKKVTGANVVIRDDEGVEWKLCEYTEAGIYTTLEPEFAKANMNYTLEVRCDFNEDGIEELYTAQSYVYGEIELDSMKLEPMNFFNKNYYNALVYVMEPKGKNFYMYRFYLNGLMARDKISDYLITSDEMFDNQYISDISFYNFPNISDIDQYEEEIIENYFFLTSGDYVEIEMSEISNHYYEFIAQCNKEFEGENPMFGGPAANIQTNIKGGAVGYFATFNGSRASCYVP